MGLIGLNVCAVVLALNQGYFLHGKFTFNSPGNTETSNNIQEYGKYVAAGGSGIVVNQAIIAATSVLASSLPEGQALMFLNGSKFAATGVSMTWNFLGFKFLVFRKRNKVLSN